MSMTEYACQFMTGLLRTRILRVIVVEIDASVSSIAYES